MALIRVPDTRHSSHITEFPALNHPISDRSIKNDEDIELLTKIIARDETALVLLYRKYQRPVYSLAMRLLNSEKEAVALLEEVFLHVWEKAPLFDIERGTLEAWMLSITHHRAIDLLKTRRKKQAITNKATDAQEEVGEQALSTNVAIHGSELSDAALDGLPADQREALDLAYYDGLSRIEIAARLNVSVDLVKSHIRTGMMHLRSVTRSAVDNGN